MKAIFPLLLVLLLLCACGAPQEPLPEPEESAAPLRPADEPAAPGDRELTLDGSESYLRVTLPEGWTWEEAGGPPDARTLALRPGDGEDFTVELHWWSTPFAMCGTGVSFSDYTLPDGRRATLAIEEQESQRFWTLILPESPDSFTIQIAASPAAFEAHEQELALLLDSLRLGVLAGLHPVTEDLPSADS